MPCWKRGRNPFGAGTVFQLKDKDKYAGINAVAIPLEQGRFFNEKPVAPVAPKEVAIPLEQGRFFNLLHRNASETRRVAIPLEQGRFFNNRTTL